MYFTFAPMRFGKFLFWNGLKFTGANVSYISDVKKFNNNPIK